ncbi:MAG: methionine adenosyltransferase [Candidatus Odinarchaeota archaeon]
MIMQRNINVNTLNLTPIENQEMEIVERKGKGHPDTICDAIAEEVSRKLSRYYLDNFGRILHHNVDKASLAGGRARAVFGGGEILEPIYILMLGRAVSEIVYNGGIERVPLGTLCGDAIRDKIENTIRYLDVERHLIIDHKIRAGSSDLVGLFNSAKEIPKANDTSFGVAYAPLSETERIVLQTELMLNSPEYKKKLPEIGEDIKVMGLRQKDKIKLTIAAAMISTLIPDLDHYLNVKEQVKNDVLDLAAKITEREITVDVNTADIVDRNNPCVYITVTGTSAENGDDGQVGRGNRANGLITPFRTMSLEATSGKNPVSHVGKIYNVLAMDIADQIVEKISGVKEVYIRILSQIGKPIDQPLVANAQVILENGVKFNTVNSDIVSIIDENLENITKITERFLKGEAKLY